MSELKQLERLLTQGKITRRDFLARLSALGITAATISGVVGYAGQSRHTPKRRAAETRHGRRFDH